MSVVANCALDLVGEIHCLQRLHAADCLELLGGFVGLVTGQIQLLLTFCSKGLFFAWTRFRSVAKVSLTVFPAFAVFGRFSYLGRAVTVSERSMVIELESGRMQVALVPFVGRAVHLSEVIGAFLELF